jgi:hypothetical protein
VDQQCQMGRNCMAVTLSHSFLAWIEVANVEGLLVGAVAADS